MEKWFTRSNAYRTIVAIALLTLLMGYLATKIQFTYDHERYFSKEGEEWETYERYKKDFLSSDTRTVLALQLKDNLLNQQVLLRLHRLTDELDAHELVEHVISIDRLKYGIRSPTGISRIDMIDIDDPGGYASDSLRMANTDNIVGGLVDSTFRIVAVQLYTKFELSKPETDSLMAHIDKSLKASGFDDYHIGGRLVNKAHILDKMKWEMGMFVTISFFLVLIILGIVFRSVWGIIVPLIVVVCTAVWTVGLMALFGKEIDVLSAMIPSILFIVGVSDVIHIYNKYLDGLRRSMSKTDAIIRAYKQVGKATFITSVTTSIGFLSLSIAALKPMWEFGLYTAAGVMIAFLLSFSLFPAFLVLLPKPKVVLFKDSKNAWREFLSRSYEWVAAHQRGIIITSVLLIGVCIYAAVHLKINNYLTEELPKDDPLRESFSFFEDHFKGMRTFDLAIQVKDTSNGIFDYEVIRQIEQLDNYISNEYGVGNLLSPAVLVKQANQIEAGGDYRVNFIPDEEEYQQLGTTLKRLRRLKYFESIVHKNGREARISGNMKDEGGGVHIQKNEALLEYAAQNSPDLTLTFTGMSHLVDINSSQTTRSLLKSLAAALLVIGVIMALLYRSPKMLFIAVVSNTLPLLLMSLAMYLAGIDLKVVTALIFTVAFGITVDDTIHMLGNLNIELREGAAFSDALKHTFVTTGKSIILTTIILFVGFISLSLSAFSSTYYFGLLVSLGLLIAVIVDLTLLPALLLAFEKKK